MADQTSIPSTSSLLAHRSQVINLAAGPSSLPTSVLLEATAGLLDYNNTGIGLTELSHRSSHFQNLVNDAKRDYLSLLQVPGGEAEWDVLFLQGGGLTQFSMVPMNLISSWKIKNKTSKMPRVEYIVSGSWSLKALGEAKRLGYNVSMLVDGRVGSKDGKTFGEKLLPSESEWNWTPDTTDPQELPAFVYYCSNETVNGIEIEPPQLPAHYKDVPIVADMSSNIASRPIPWSSTPNFGLIYAGAQKNLGPSGCTIVLIRKDLVCDPDEAAREYAGDRIPAMMAYKSHADNNSLYNTPPMFPIYVCALVFKHLLALGGVDSVRQTNAQKAESVYSTVDASGGFYQARVVEGFRSKMNICFGLPSPDGSTARETRFVAEAEKAGIKQIKGHRSVGGIRTSLYNAVTLEQVQTLVGFMKHFQQKEQEIEWHTKDD